jgi:hypothetical protein
MKPLLILVFVLSLFIVACDDHEQRIPLLQAGCSYAPGYYSCNLSSDEPAEGTTTVVIGGFE